MKSFSIYKCNECSETLHNKFNFLEHQNIHSGETPFMCINCRRCFSLINQYIDHTRNYCYQTHTLRDSEFECGQPENVSSVFDGKMQKVINFNGDKSLEAAAISNNSYNCSKLSGLKISLNGRQKEELKHIKSNETTLNKYHCSLCQIDFKSINKYEMHKKESHNFICRNCNKKFFSREKLALHACFISSAGESFKCSCHQTFTKSSAFKFHIGSKPYSCCSCSMQFNTITNLIRHIRTHTKQKPYVCKDCGRGFSQSAHLRNHSSIHLGVRAIKCNECNFSCKTHNGLLKHKKKHKEGFINHQNYVDGRKKSTNASSCPICNKQFLFKRNMGMHMKIHSNKISLCTECGKVFDSKGKLTSHYKACHREPSVCKTCGKIFASAVLLSAHEKIHVSDKLFLCNICHKTFSVKNYLVQHMKTHSNRKQFSCSKCGKLFKVAVSLKYHNNICTSLNIPV